MGQTAKKTTKLKEKTILMAISRVFLSSHYNVEANELEWMDRRALHSKQSALCTCSIHGNLFRDLINLLLYVKRPHYSKQYAMYVLSFFLRSDQWLMLIADIHCPSSAKFYVMIVVFYVKIVAFLAPGLKILQSSHKTFCFFSIK